jgi:hypothetical protein
VQLPQGDRDRGRLDRAARHGQSSGELVDTLGPAVAQGLQHPPCCRSERDSQVGQLGQGALVGTAEVVTGQHGAGAPGHARPTAPAGTATGAGEHQVLRVVAGWELAADRLDHDGGEGHRADTGVALGARLEAAPKRPAW